MNMGGKKYLLISVLGAVLLAIYLGWRAIFTLPSPHVFGWVAFIAGILLLTAEALSIVESIISYIEMNRRYMPEMPEISPGGGCFHRHT